MYYLPHFNAMQKSKLAKLINRNAIIINGHAAYYSSKNFVLNQNSHRNLAQMSVFWSILHLCLFTGFRHDLNRYA